MKCIIVDFTENSSTSIISREVTCSCGTLVRASLSESPTQTTFFCPICGKSLAFFSEDEIKFYKGKLQDKKKTENKPFSSTLSPEELEGIFNENFN